MKTMSAEISATLMIIFACWLILLALDILICAGLRLFFGIPFAKALLWGMTSLLLPPVLTAYGTFIERNCIRVKEVTIAFEDLPAEFEGYRIAHISDIHGRSFKGREEQLQKAADKINSLAPDMIAFTGDLITISPDELDALVPALGSLGAKDGVFSVLGNHDYSIYSDASEQERQKHLADLIAMEKALGWDLLMDENRIIRRGNDSIAVIGVQNTSTSRHFPSKGDLKAASDGTDGLFRIVLTHDPMHWEAEILGNDYPLTLSGHTHAMQLSILGWSPSRLMFKQSRGLYSEKNQSIYVNPGLGETIFPARIGVRPEITLITLSRSAQQQE